MYERETPRWWPAIAPGGDADTPKHRRYTHHTASAWGHKDDYACQPHTCIVQHELVTQYERVTLQATQSLSPCIIIFISKPMSSSMPTTIVTLASAYPHAGDAPAADPSYSNHSAGCASSIAPNALTPTAGSICAPPTPAQGCVYSMRELSGSSVVHCQCG